MSKKVFNDPALRELLTEAHDSDHRVSGAIATTRYAPFIGTKDLKMRVKEEFKLMMLFIKHMVKCGLR